MKIESLINFLKDFGGDKEVYISKDETGNIIYDNFFVDMDNNKVIIYPFGDQFRREE